MVTNSSAKKTHTWVVFSSASESEIWGTGFQDHRNHLFPQQQQQPQMQWMRPGKVHHDQHSSTIYQDVLMLHTDWQGWPFGVQHRCKNVFTFFIRATFFYSCHVFLFKKNMYWKSHQKLREALLAPQKWINRS